MCEIVLLTSLMAIPSFASQRVGNQLASSATSINYSDSFRGRTTKLTAMNGSLVGTEARGEWKVYIEGAGFSTSQATSTITVYYDVLN